MEPLTSVVFATYNRAALLPRLVHALVDQKGVGSFEIVAVDDASSDDTWATLRRLAALSPAQVHPIHLERNGGPARARNAGWRAASGVVVCFVDDDCVPTSGWLAALLRGLSDADIAQGRTLPNPEQAAQRGPFSRTVNVPFEQGYYETCNIAYRRSLLEQLGGFDEVAFGSDANGEDVDLAWRAKAQGSTATFVPEALVHHDVWPSSFRACLRELRRRDGLVLMFKKHPQLRVHLRKGLFFRPTHWAALLALAGVGTLAARPRSAPRQVAAAAVGLWYAWQVRLHRPPPSRRLFWVSVVPGALVIDVSETMLMLRASIRHQYLLL